MEKSRNAWKKPGFVRGFFFKISVDTLRIFFFFILTNGGDWSERHKIVCDA